MSLIKRVHEVRIVRDIDGNCECTITIISETFIARLNVANIPVRIPPACSYTNLRICCLNIQIESGTLNLVPCILRELGETFIVAIVTLKSETIDTTPANCTASAVALPEDNFLFTSTAGNFINEIDFQRRVTGTVKSRCCSSREPTIGSSPKLISM